MVKVCLYHRSTFSISNEDVVSLMKFHLMFPILLECALPRVFEQRTFSHCLEAFSALLGTGECSQ